MKNLIIILFAAITIHSIAQNSPKLRRIEGQGNDGWVLDFAPYMHDSILNSTCFYNYPLYDNKKGPVYVDVYNPSLTPAGDYQIVFNGGLDTAKWKLVHLPTNTTVFGTATTGVDYTQDIPQWGMKIRTKPTDDPSEASYTYSGFLEATMSFKDTTKQWLTGVSDKDGQTNFNWIRSGTTTGISPQFDDYSYNFGVDDYQEYENVLGGTWAPFRLCAYTVAGGGTKYIGGPGYNNTISVTSNKIKNVASVDVVITADKSKWTRCPVLELQEDPLLATGGAIKLNMRKSQSLDKNGIPASVGAGSSTNPGDPNYISETGMGWFPGYAINLETGERLNMAFGEDSWFQSENGNDMIWNPTSTVSTTIGSDPIFGGKHYIYIFGHNGNATYSATDLRLPNKLKDVPCYDAGKTICDLLQADPTNQNSAYKREVYTDAMWVNIPLLNPGHNLLETDVNIRLRVSKRYRQFAVNNINNTNPMYLFNTNSLVGVDEKNINDNFISLYPNPCTNIIRVNYTTSEKNYTIKIYDVTGKIVIDINNIHPSETTINVENLDTGIYLLNVYDGKKSITHRFVKK